MYQIFPLQTPSTDALTFLIVGDIRLILADAEKNNRTEFDLKNAQKIQLTKNPNMKNQGSEACRWLLQKFFFPNSNDFQANFDETEFPYRLNFPDNIVGNLDNFSHLLSDFNQYPIAFNLPDSYYISFSHSQYNVAILLSSHAILGVDVEDKMVSEAVSQRYFLPIELDWVQSLPITEQALGRKLLWTLKESLIKAQASQDSQLITGLKINLLQYLTVEQMGYLIKPVSETGEKYFNIIEVSNNSNKGLKGQFGFSPHYQCGFYRQF